MTRVLQQRALVVFVPPDLLEELIVEGHARASSNQDDDREGEGFEDADEGFGDEVAEVHIPDSDEPVSALREPDPFYDWNRFPESSAHEDDPHEALLQRIGALSNGGRW